MIWKAEIARLQVFHKPIDKVEVADDDTEEQQYDVNLTEDLKDSR